MTNNERLDTNLVSDQIEARALELRAEETKAIEGSDRMGAEQYLLTRGDPEWCDIYRRLDGDTINGRH